MMPEFALSSLFSGRLALIARLPPEKRMLLADAYFENTEEYYFERSASLFNVVYQFYLTGYLSDL